MDVNFFWFLRPWILGPSSHLPKRNKKKKPFISTQVVNYETHLNMNILHGVFFVCLGVMFWFYFVGSNTRIAANSRAR